MSLESVGLQGERQSQKLTRPLSESGEAPQLPVVFDYDDYRRFLKDWFGFKKNQNKSYSGALFARRAGLSSHTILGMVIRGDRNLSHKTIRAFARALELSARETVFFEKLVLFNQSGNSDDKNYYLEQLLSVSRGKSADVLRQFKGFADLFSSWFVPTIYEMIQLKDFRPDPEWIVKKLKKKLTKKQVQDALKILKNLKLAEFKKEPGQSKANHVKIDFDPGSTDFALRRFHKDVLARVEDAIENESVDERELSSTVISVSRKEIEMIRKEIRELNISIAERYPIDKSNLTDAIMICSQVLFLTKEREGDEDVH